MGPGSTAMPYAPADPASLRAAYGHNPVPGPPVMPSPAYRPEGWVGGQGPMAPNARLPAAMASSVDARPCSGAQIMARVGADIILTSDVLAEFDEFIERYKDKIPADQFQQQRKMIWEETTAGINDLAAHINEPNPASQLDAQRRAILQQLLKLQIEVKLVNQDFRRTVPKENLPNVQESIYRQFDDTELKRLLKRENVPGRQELEWKLRAQGSSLEREKRIFMERVIAGQWRREQVKIDKEITHEEMLAWYQAHVAEFEKPARARWEELMVSLSKYPTKDEAQAVIARMGNQLLAGAPLAQVAKSQSDGATASEGGARDWTSRGSLACQEMDRALFGLPLGQLSPIIESPTGLHIIRVVERQDIARTPFHAAQVEIRKKIQQERTNKQYQEYVTRLQGQFPIWTIFDEPGGNPRTAAAEDRRY